MKNNKITCILIYLSVLLVSCSTPPSQPDGVVIENEEMRLVISPDGTARSLIYKPTGEECLAQGVRIPAFSILVEAAYNETIKANMILLGMHEFMVDSVYLKNDQIIAHFDIINIDAIINIDKKPDYINFELEGLNYGEYDLYKTKYIPEKYELWFLRLPVRERKNFGNWLNVMWDNQVAVNLLGSNIFTHIDSETRDGYRIMKAGCFSELSEEGASACLVTTSPNTLFDRIGKVEDDYKLPHGVENRKRKESVLSSYWSEDVNPGNVDRHIKYALQGGFRSFYIYYPAFVKGPWHRPGHFEWRDTYPNGIDDLKAVVEKIEKAGLTCGVHLHFNKAGKGDPYVTPVPDHRLHCSRYYTLAAPLGMNDTTIFVEENPWKATLADDRRILKIGDELISYTSYTKARPYKFTGCERGILNTKTGTARLGTVFGLMDVDTWPEFIRLDQNTSIQEEVAEKIADIYHQAGLKFAYFDGAEDVHYPYWYTTAKAQWEVYKRLEPEPLFAGAAAMSHFCWHMLSRGNHYDSHFWLPEIMKEQIQKYLGTEAPLMAKNFTSTSFGRYQYFAPGEVRLFNIGGDIVERTIGIQPDMLEYTTSKAAAWDSPWIIKAYLDAFDEHPRTTDNLEVIKRWEDAKAQGFLTKKQKAMLKDWDQEYILLVDEQQDFELQPYEQVKDVAGGSKDARAFVFEREDGLYAVYWHTTGSGQLEMPVASGDILMLDEIGQDPQQLTGNGKTVTLPIGNRRYLKTSKLTREAFITSLRNAKIVD